MHSVAETSFQKFCTEVCILSHCSLRPPLDSTALTVTLSPSKPFEHAPERPTFPSEGPSSRILDGWKPPCTIPIFPWIYHVVNVLSVDHDPKTNRMRSSSYCDVLTVHAICHNCSNIFLCLWFFFFQFFFTFFFLFFFCRGRSFQKAFWVSGKTLSKAVLSFLFGVVDDWVSL